KQPTDKYLDGYFKSNRYAGSKDKRAMRGIIYNIYRNLRQYEFVIGSAEPRSLVIAYLLGQGDDAAKIAEKFNGEKYAAANLTDDETKAITEAKNLDDAPKAVSLNLADWQFDKFSSQFGDKAESEVEALNQTASLDVRINTAQTNIEDAKKALSKQDGLTFVCFAGGLRVPVPANEKAELSDKQRVVMGLRTEEISLVTENSTVPKEWIFSGVVKVVEPLGNENHLHVEINGESFVARCEGRRIVKVGAKIDIAFNLEQLHIFDAETTKVIYQTNHIDLTE
ncbi:MAG: hypothetical protein COA36_10890, partial [Desulfotalea sp.]